MPNKKRKRKNSGFQKYWKRAEKTIRKPYDALSEDQRFWIGFAFLCIITTLLVNNPFTRGIASQYSEGDIARESIISPADITVIDEQETDAIRKSVAATVKPIFTLQSSTNGAETFRTQWNKFSSKPKGNATKDGSSSESGSYPEWEGAGGAELGKVFSARRFTTSEINSIMKILEDSSELSIYDDKDKQFLAPEVTLIDRKNPNSAIVVSLPETAWMPLSEVRKNALTKLKDLNSLSETEVTAFDKAISPLIQPNVVYDSAATAKAKSVMISSVEPIEIRLKRGQYIVREGDTITAATLSEVNAIESNSKSSRLWNRFFGVLILISAFYWIAWKFIQNRGIVSRLDLSEYKTFALFGFVAIVQTAIMVLSFRIADFTALQNIRAPLNDASIWSFAIPFAFSSLLMTLLADRRIALFSGAFTAIIAGMLAPKGLEFTIYASISSAVAVYGIGRYRSRSSVTVAGGFVGVVNALAAVALLAYTQQPFILNTVLLTVSCGLASGLIAAAATAAFLPFCETIFGILTDVKLLEMSNADLPVLGQLALRAPGTNQHSHAVGQLAEEACRQVGANGLLARIGALYHDIGKTAAPEHFVENQMRGNPHDKLKASQSAKIIISHVTYGIKLAKEMGLPQRIVDFIPQHHGTRTLHYFLTKAKEEAGKGEEIHTADYRYPGPKPQFKEAAIMMIADSCEAAARSLSEPTPENIRFIVTKIIDAILSDDQLDECDLTLRELTKIRESMIKSLISIYHSRVDYPGYVPPSNSTAKLVVPKELIEAKSDNQYQDPKEIPISKGGEIEEEMSAPFETRPDIEN